MLILAGGRVSMEPARTPIRLTLGLTLAALSRWVNNRRLTRAGGSTFLGAASTKAIARTDSTTDRTTEAALSFLGIGVPPPTATWGNVLGGVLAESFKPRWWPVVFPGMSLTVTVLAANLFGDAVRDFLDPKLRGRLGAQTST